MEFGAACLHGCACPASPSHPGSSVTCAPPLASQAGRLLLRVRVDARRREDQAGRAVHARRGLLDRGGGGAGESTAGRRVGGPEAGGALRPPGACWLLACLWACLKPTTCHGCTPRHARIRLPLPPQEGIDCKFRRTEGWAAQLEPQLSPACRCRCRCRRGCRVAAVCAPGLRAASAPHRWSSIGLAPPDPPRAPPGSYLYPHLTGESPQPTSATSALKKEIEAAHRWVGARGGRRVVGGVPRSVGRAGAQGGWGGSAGPGRRGQFPPLACRCQPRPATAPPLPLPPHLVERSAGLTDTKWVDLGGGPGGWPSSAAAGLVAA